MPTPLTPTTDLADSQLADLVTDRFNAITDGEEYDPDLHGPLILIQPGDTLAEVQQLVTCNVITDVPVEYAEEHATCWELVFIPGDGDYGVILFVPKEVGIDVTFTDACMAYLEDAHE